MLIKASIAARAAQNTVDRCTANVAMVVCYFTYQFVPSRVNGRISYIDDHAISNRLLIDMLQRLRIHLLAEREMLRDFCHSSFLFLSSGKADRMSNPIFIVE